MSKASFKRQKVVASKAFEPLVPPTKYDPSPATLKNFPSSIVNGVTAEGGLFSLTFKAVTAATYIENADLIRKTLFDADNVDLSRITDKEFEGEVSLQQLQAEISELKKEATSKPQIAAESSTTLKDELQQVLESGENLSGIGKALIADYNVANPNKSLIFCDKAYKDVKDLKLPGLKVEKFEDVKEIDLRPYHKEASAAEVLAETITEPVIEPIESAAVEGSVIETVNEQIAPVAIPVSEPAVEAGFTSEVNTVLPVQPVQSVQPAQPQPVPTEFTATIPQQTINEP